MAASKKIDQKSIAKSLYIDGSYTHEEIAEKVGVARQTVTKWANAGKWQELKASLSITPAQLIAQWQQQIAEINAAITSREQGKRFANPAEADAMNKLASAIRKLQEDMGVTDVISVSMRFLTWLRPVDRDLAMKFNSLLDAFIKDIASQ